MLYILISQPAYVYTNYLIYLRNMFNFWTGYTI